ncbi:ATPase family AAA domain-containing protein 2-like isoform X2 [Cylas formicarius]|nr:ATPase family AAA domain-containing protein 2-like isoform X2 [Cylas formicarius]XP_060536538.1 ATPase family AAA domain-containing protein 2-like isoform X2 [Cylas formicarius]XP_060536539.1 ATPase family AAA domain-containing protein 2-like isoform X2 [Cylas formicarius]
MVHTRRMESNGSRPVGHHHRTRGRTKIELAQDSGSSSAKDSDSEGSNTEDDSSFNTTPEKESQQLKKKDPEKAIEKVISIRSDFQRKFTDRSLTTNRERILTKRRGLAVYSRKIKEEMDLENGNYSEEEFYPRGHRARHLVKKNRMLRRTALSLRPISQKCYVDHSPIRLDDTDSDSMLRKGTKKSKNLSWLTDNQMHKVGYPNLHAGYSEEDSRDAGENIELSQRVTRHSTRRRVVKPSYYYDEDYDERPEIRKRNRAQRVFRSRRETVNVENNKENKEEHFSMRTRSSRNEEIAKETVKEEPDKEDGEQTKEDKENEEINIGGVTKKENSSESEGQPQPERLRDKREFTTRKKVLESSSESEEEEEEEGRKYLLRNRPPKPTSKTRQTSVLRNDRINDIRRRRFTRRRKVSSSSDSSTSSSDLCRKQTKSPHSKNEKMKSGAGGSSRIIPIKPETLDASIRFNSIGGLDAHVQCLKEMILLPMMYPEVFRQFQVQPPKGVLFHGAPGTGKTLIARALANECSFGSRRVAFFMRKGADLLSKWIGESEKQLRLLFQQAAEMKPSIIFFDELDGLAPVRSSRQDQVHASIVSTLLALMDGLDDRGNVIVIGATNRIDAIDPALRRPGRFDRELFFPLPSRMEREEILKVHVAAWTKPPTADLLSYLAENTVGYCGSDLRALCSEAVIQGFRRTYPQVYDSEHRLLLDPQRVVVEKVDFMRAKSLLVPASQRIAQGLGRKLLPILEPILQNTIRRALSVIEQSFPHGFNITLSKVKLSANVRPAQLLLSGHGPQHGQTTHVAPAILFKMEHIHAYLLDLATLFREPGRTPEEACLQVFHEAKRNVPSIIYIPNIDQWWELVTETVRAIVTSQLSQIDPNVPFLFMATSCATYDNLPQQLKNIFSSYRKELFEVRPPNSEARRAFFRPLIVEGALRPPKSAREQPRTPPLLPRAPTPPPTPLTEDQAKKLYETEEHTLRELRIFLRDMCKKLANNKLFFMFTKPVDTDEVPDYTEIIKQPMDLETMMTKVDFHRYECAKDFLNDIDLICHNALEYNPARSSADKQIRHRACSLRDYAYTLIKTEMDTDFEDKCQDIKQKRRVRKACVSKYLPAYIQTQDANLNNRDNGSEEPSESVSHSKDLAQKTSERSRISPIRKRKFNWQRGYLKKRKKTKVDSSHHNKSTSSKEKHSSDESKENDPDSSTMDIRNPSPETRTEAAANRTAELTTALTINCDTQRRSDLPSQSSHSPKRRLADLMSPSELLDSPLYFDDVEQALNESVLETSAKPVECSQIELEKLLEQTVKCTDGFTLSMLLDLYNQFNAIVKKFSKSYVRSGLPRELMKELLRFKKSSESETSCRSRSSVDP